jgi:hypothetical protein
MKNYREFHRLLWPSGTGRSRLVELECQLFSAATVQQPE